MYVQDLNASQESTDSAAHAQMEHMRQLEGHLLALQQELVARDAAVDSIRAERDALAAQVCVVILF